MKVYARAQRTRASSPRSASSHVYRKPAPQGRSLGTLLHKPAPTGQTDMHAIIRDVLRSPGQPLDPATRSFMEPRFGYDFSNVLVHSGTAAEQSARSVSASAYTVGRDIVFGAGRFAPGTREGRRLIAHELTHVVQSGSSSNINRETIYRQPDGGKPQADKPKEGSAAALMGIVAEARRDVMDRMKEVAEAHRVYLATGLTPQTRTKLFGIEIKEGRLMNRAERYDAMVRKLGMGKTIAQADDIAYDNRDPEYLTQTEFKEEYWARYHAERDNCYDEYFWPKYERQCIRRVQEKYGGESFIAWREGRERELAYRIQVAKSQIDSVASSGAIGTLGRAAGYAAARVSGHDEQEALEWSEYGAGIGGLGDAYLAVKAGATARAGTQNYNEGGGHVVSRDAPMTPPPQNVAAPPKNEPSPTPGNTSTSTAVTDPWAPPQTPAPRLSVNEVKQDLLSTIKEVNNLPESNPNKASTLKELRDLLKKTNALEQVEKKGTDVSGSLNEIDRRHIELDEKVADAIVRSNESLVPKPAPTPPKPGEVRNPSVPTANKPSGNVRWIEDEPAMSDYARKYEHGAPGARSRVDSKRGQVPALDWVKPGGSAGQVKFDGIDDTVLVDRKISVTTFEGSKDQALRQSEALRQNGYTGRWEVPDAKEKAVAEKMFTDLGITNITVKIEPTK